MNHRDRLLERAASGRPTETPKTARRRGPAEVRFWRFVTPEPNTGCWLWSGTLCNGYGYFNAVSGRPMVRAHRFAYEMENGPVPPGLFVLHSCDTPWCVNPAHLRAGTVVDNMHDMDARGRRRPSAREANRHAKLTAREASEVASRRLRGESTKQLAAEYGVNRTTVQRIVNGQRWRSLREAR